ncbi:hypothetical protein EDD16DRAFT_818242 [Pisolithus croceorrhizus]|nr:hypothetical protein EDD16DRAFT_818242 [Pisolithus croceorrhizus]
MVVGSVMGLTGSGKSTFIDRAVERPDTGAGHDLTSCTTGVCAIRYPTPMASATLFWLTHLDLIILI